MKEPQIDYERLGEASRPARGEWIERRLAMKNADRFDVSPRKGRVD